MLYPYSVHIWPMTVVMHCSLYSTQVAYSTESNHIAQIIYMNKSNQTESELFFLNRNTVESFSCCF